MRSVSVREAPATEHAREPIGFFLPISAKDRRVGRESLGRLGDERIELFLAERRWGESTEERPRRIRAFVRARKVDDCIDDAIYAALEDEARVDRAHLHLSPPLTDEEGHWPGDVVEAEFGKCAAAA